nr:methylenetetrahydrofolate reductase 1 [Tanacetum cinerariifolium]
MVRDITNEEIKSAMFDIGDDKSPGPDGFTSTFFKKGWEVVGNDVCNAVRDFFSNGCILKEINHTESRKWKLMSIDSSCINYWLLVFMHWYSYWDALGG